MFRPQFSRNGMNLSERSRLLLPVQLYRDRRRTFMAHSVKNGFGCGFPAEDGIFHRKVFPSPISTRRKNVVRFEMPDQGVDMFFPVFVEHDIRVGNVDRVHGQYSVLPTQYAAFLKVRNRAFVSLGEIDRKSTRL